MEAGKKDSNTQARLLFSLKSETTTNRLHISLGPDHDSDSTALEKEWNNTHTVTIWTVVLYLLPANSDAVVTRSDLTCFMLTLHV